MRLFPEEPVICDLDGFTQETDIFNRRAIGESLTNLVTAVEHPLVIALDAPWGSGKSIFLKMWAGELRNNRFPVVYFDCFANDHVDDPFSALASEVVELAAASQDQSVKKQITEKAVGAGKWLLRTSAKASVRAATAGLINAADIEGLKDALGSDAPDDISNAADKYMREILGSAKQRKTAYDEFRESLSALPELLHKATNTGDEKAEDPRPLIFIIDELDRCTPTFALGLLERIKHFFAVPNVHFVLGVHLEQLSNSVRAAYGPQTAAELYLQKFIHFTVPLAETENRADQTAVWKYVSYLTQNMGADSLSGNAQSVVDDCLKALSTSKGLSLRSIERIYSATAVTLASANKPHQALAPLVVGLCALKVLHPDLYAKAKRNQLSYLEASHALGLDEVPQPGAESRHKWIRECWTFATNPEDKSIDQNPFDSGQLFRVPISGRDGYIGYTANVMIDRFQFT